MQLGSFFDEDKYILLIIGNIIIYFFINLFIWLIIDKFNPNYTPLAHILEGASYFIIDSLITGDSKNEFTLRWDVYFRIFLYIILIFVVLTHNEIIIINICGLASETKYLLDLKLESEELYSDSDNLYKDMKQWI